MNTLAAPGGFLVAGQMLERRGVMPVFGGVAGGMSLAAVALAATVLRGEEEATPDAAAAAGA